MRDMYSLLSQREASGEDHFSFSGGVRRGGGWSHLGFRFQVAWLFILCDPGQGMWYF